MKYKFTLGVSAFSFLLFLFPTYILVSRVSLAQIQDQKQSNVAKLFDQAASKHKRELDDLLVLRGARPIFFDNVSSQNVARVLSVRDERYDEATYLEKTAVLFYSYENEVLQVWLVNEYGIQAYHKRKISENQINEAITNLRNSIGVDSLALTRSLIEEELSLVELRNKPIYLLIVQSLK